MPKFKYEIEYFYQVDKNDSPRVHWMYVEIEARTIASSKTKALEHYNRQTRECGWTKYCTLNEIRPLRQPNDPPKHKTVVEEKLKPKTRRTTTTRKKPVPKKTVPKKPAAKKPAAKKPTTRKKK